MKWRRLRAVYRVHALVVVADAVVVFVVREPYGPVERFEHLAAALEHGVTLRALQGLRELQSVATHLLRVRFVRQIGRSLPQLLAAERLVVGAREVGGDGAKLGWYTITERRDNVGHGCDANVVMLRLLVCVVICVSANGKMHARAAAESGGAEESETSRARLN